MPDDEVAAALEALEAVLILIVEGAHELVVARRRRRWRLVPSASRLCGRSGATSPCWRRPAPSCCAAPRSRGAPFRSRGRVPTRTSCAKRNTERSVKAVRMARAEYQGCPPRVVRGSAAHAAIAASVNQIVKLPRWRRLAS